MPDKLTQAQRDSHLPALRDRGWSHDPDRDAISKTYKFADFQAAFAFMTRIAPVADGMDHHPEWRNVYNTVEVTLTTHDVDGLSALDIELAQHMDDAA